MTLILTSIQTVKESVANMLAALCHDAHLQLLGHTCCSGLSPVNYNRRDVIKSVYQRLLIPSRSVTRTGSFLADFTRISNRQFLGKSLSPFFTARWSCMRALCFKVEHKTTGPAFHICISWNHRLRRLGVGGFPGLPGEPDRHFGRRLKWHSE